MLAIKTKPKTQINKHVFVIKQKKDHWDLSQRYFYTRIDDKTHIYTFLNKNAADNCMQFLKNYKKINFKYPECDTDDTFDIVIEKEPLDVIVKRCRLSCVNLLGIFEFNCDYSYSIIKGNKYDVCYKSIDLFKNEQISNEEYIDNLNYIFDCF
jgi:hypothetical protein